MKPKVSLSCQQDRATCPYTEPDHSTLLSYFLKIHFNITLSFTLGSYRWSNWNRTYLLTPWCRILLEKLTGLQLVKKFPAFHGTRRFITALTRVRHLSLSWANPIQSTSHLLEIHPNIIHPSMPRSPQWSLSLRFPHQDPTHHLSSPIRTTCPAYLIGIELVMPSKTDI